MNIEQRNREIEESMKTGTRAFAAGAMLLLTLALVGPPVATTSDAVSVEPDTLGASVAAAVSAESPAVNGVDARELSP
jgi:hypothetical protein